MSNIELESAVLFTPGRASYVTAADDGSFQLNLTESSQNRAILADEQFNPDFHTTALFAGGYPAVAGWPAEHIPARGHREASLMAQTLVNNLYTEGYEKNEIAEYVKIQDESSSSLSDVAISMQRGFLSPDEFNQEGERHGIDLIAGRLHGMRFFDILAVGLDMDPKLINLLKSNDVYSRPANEFEPRKFAAVEIAKEGVGILLTRRVLKDVEPGNADSLLEADQRLNDIIAKQK